MPKSIDERIVDMKFNNEQFEKKVKRTIKSLDELDKSLDFKNAEKSFASIERASGRVNLNSIGRSIESISSKFSTLGVVGFTVIQNLTNSALRLGQRLTSALTVRPVLDGLNEYELKMNSIQTILTNTSSKGTTLDQVNETLEELNEYADRTIYNFAQMTANLGRFTAAGSSLEDSAIAIKGLSNVAAGFGVDATRMAGATFQMAEALAKGVVQLQDWRSLETAGLSGQMLQDAFRDTAEEMGVIIDRGTAFRETLRDGWLTTDVFIETMRKMANDPSLLAAAQNVTTFTKLVGTLQEVLGSGWAQTWEAILGGKDQSTRLWTGISNALGDVIAAEASARTELFKFWSEQGGRTDVLVGIGNILQIIANAIKPIEDGFRAVFDPITGDTLVNVSKRFRELTESFKIGENTGKALSRIFKGLFSGVSILLKGIKILSRGFVGLLSLLKPTGVIFLELLATIGDLFVGFDTGVFSLDGLASSFKTFVDLVKPVTNVINAVLTSIIGGITLLIKSVSLDPLVDGIVGAKNRIVSVLKSIYGFFSGLKDLFSFGEDDTILEGTTESLENVETAATKTIGVLNKIRDIISNALSAIVDFVNEVVSGVSGASGELLKTTDIISGFGRGISYILTLMANVLDGIYGFIGDSTNKIKDWISNLTFDDVVKIISTGLLIKVVSVYKSFVKSLQSVVKSFAGVFKSVSGVIDNASNILSSVRDTMESYQNTLKAKTLTHIAVAIGILAASVIALSFVDPSKLTTALAAMTGSVANILGAMYVINKIMDAGVVRGLWRIIPVMIGMSVAILILSNALNKLKNLNIQQVLNGLAGIAGIAIVLAGAIKLLDSVKGPLLRASVGFIAFSFALDKIADVLLKLKGLDLDEIGRGLLALAGIGVILSGFTALTGISNSSLRAAIVLLGLTYSINKIVDVLEILGNKDIAALKQSLLGLTTIITSLGIFMVTLSKFPGSATSALTVVAIAGSIYLIGVALNRLSSLTWSELAKGLSAMVGAVGILITATKLFKGIGFLDLLSLFLLTSDIYALGKGLKLVTELSWSDIGRGLTAMVGSIGILLAASYAINASGSLLPATSLLIIAGSMILLGETLTKLGELSWGGIGRGLTAMLGAMTILAAAAYAMAGGIAGAVGVAAMAAALTLVVPPLLLLSTVSWGGLTAGLTLLAGAIAIFAGAATLVTPIIPMMLALGASLALIGATVALSGAGLFLFAAGVSALISAMVEAGGSVKYFVEQLIDALPVISKAFVEGLKEMGKALPELGSLLIDGIKTIASVINDAATVIVDAVADLVIKLLRVIDDRLPEFITLGVSIIKSLLTGISENIEEFTQLGIDTILGYIRGITSRVDDIIQAGVDLYVAFINGVADAIRDNKDLVIDAWTNVISAMLGVSKEKLSEIVGDFTEFGENIVEGIAKGFDKTTKWLGNETEYLVNTVKDKFTNKEGFDTNSPSKWAESIGNFLTQGLVKGMDDTTVDVEKAAKKTVGATKKAAELTAKEAKKAFDEASDQIEQRKFLNLITLEEELAEYLKLQKKYKSYSEIRKKVDREVFTLRKQLMSEDLKRSEDWINERKYYNQLGLAEEVDAWERVQKRFDIGSEQRKKADKEVYRTKLELTKTNEEYSKRVLDVEKKANEERIKLEDEYYSKTKEINDKLKNDIDTLTDSYNDALKSRTDTLFRTFGLFEKVDVGDEVNGLDLTNNLEAQVEIFEDWQKNIAELTARGIDEGLIAELKEMGPKSINELQALNNLTDESLSKYVDLWRTKHQLAREQATSELENMRLSTISQISALELETDQKLKNYNRIWSGKMFALKKSTLDEVEAIKQEWLEKVGYLRSETEVEFVLMTQNVTNTVRSENWSGLGTNIVNGMIYGVKSQSRKLAQTAAATARAALNAAKSALGVRSPSREFMKLGEFSIEGMIIGLETYRSKLVKTSSDMGNTMINNFKNTINNLSSIVNDTIDTNPTIRPVLDLTDVENKARNLSGLFSTDVNASNLALPLTSAKTQNESELPKDVSGKSTSVTFTQNNYSPKSLSRMEIYRQTRNQISKLRGVVNPT